MSARNPLDRLRLQVQWNRLLSIVEEQSQVLMRTAFNPTVRECGDLSAGFFTPDGRMMAQSVTGTPGHVNSMAMAVGHFLARYPASTLRDGDILITNDPWEGTGHLNDFTVVTPVFGSGRLVGHFACTSHFTDVGGLGFVADGRDVFMEGTRIPIQKLYRSGHLVDALMETIKANTRLPRETEGDIYALVACNAVGARRLGEMMDELRMEDCAVLADYIFRSSREAVQAEIRKLAPGTYRNRMRIDGFDEPIDLVAALTVSEDRIEVDYDGTSGLSKRGINVPLAYTAAYTCFGLSCAIAPHVPNNAGSLGAYRVSAPANSILNALFPAPVAARHVVGQMLPDVVFGCLAGLMPDRVPAEGTSCSWAITVKGPNTDPDADGAFFMAGGIMNGGTGARPIRDGLSATAFPSGVRSTPIEIVETTGPVLFWRKQYRADSGGAGRHRGGDGLEIEFEVTNGLPFEVRPNLDRIRHPPRGRAGGQPGRTGFLGTASGRILKGMGAQSIDAGERIVMKTPGGGGHGNPAERDPDAVRRDLADGLIDGWSF